VSGPAKIGAEKALRSLPAWAAAEGRDAITRTYRFPDFAAAFAFMTRVAITSEKLDHHPEWFNVYDRVDVTLATHDADGVTDLDLKLATSMEAAAKALGAK
jgi:4a-hydroxytetrahydrobiopterin dehydratase